MTSVRVRDRLREWRMNLILGCISLRVHYNHPSDRPAVSSGIPERNENLQLNNKSIAMLWSSTTLTVYYGIRYHQDTKSYAREDMNEHNDF